MEVSRVGGATNFGVGVGRSVPADYDERPTDLASEILEHAEQHQRRTVRNIRPLVDELGMAEVWCQVSHCLPLIGKELARP